MPSNTYPNIHPLNFQPPLANQGFYPILPPHSTMHPLPSLSPHPGTTIYQACHLIQDFYPNLLPQYMAKFIFQT